MDTKTNIKDLYSFVGFRAQATLKAHPEDTEARIVTLRRRQKKRLVPAVAKVKQVSAIEASMLYGIWMPRQPVFIWSLNTDGFIARIVRP